MTTPANDLDEVRQVISIASTRPLPVESRIDVSSSHCGAATGQTIKDLPRGTRSRESPGANATKMGGVPGACGNKPATCEFRQALSERTL